MSRISIEELQRDVAGYLRRAAAGETLVVFDGDQPLVEIKPITAASQELRPYGLAAGEVVTPDDFNEPLSPEVEGRIAAWRAGQAEVVPFDEAIAAARKSLKK